MPTLSHLMFEQAKLLGSIKSATGLSDNITPVARKFSTAKLSPVCRVVITLIQAVGLRHTTQILERNSGALMPYLVLAKQEGKPGEMFQTNNAAAGLPGCLPVMILSMILFIRELPFQFPGDRFKEIPAAATCFIRIQPSLSMLIPEKSSGTSNISLAVIGTRITHSNE